MPRDDETALSEITILPDGRVYVFGMSLQLLEVLQTLREDEPRLQALRQVAEHHFPSPPEGEDVPDSRPAPSPPDPSPPEGRGEKLTWRSPLERREER